MNEENIFGVYIHIFPNNKVYIGKYKKDAESRWKSGNGYRGQFVYDKIKQYGWNNIEHKVISSNMSEKEALDLEIKLIKKYKSNGTKNNFKYGYNLTDGGDGVSGNCVKKVICENIIYDCVEDCAEFYNVKANTMTKWLNGINNIPKNFYDKGLRYLNEEQNKNIGGNNKRKRKIICVELDMVFGSLAECVKYLKDNYNVKISHSEISLVLNGKRKSAKGYTFKYFDKDLRKEFAPKEGNKQKVVMLDKNKNTILKIFNSIAEAERSFNSRPSSGGVSACLCGRQKTAHGYKWIRYEELDSYL